MKWLTKLFRKKGKDTRKAIDFETILSKFTYKDGSTFYIQDYEGEPHIYIKSPVVCADTGNTLADDGTKLHLYGWDELSKFNLYDEEAFKLQLLMLCLKQEIHESMEWLRWDGNKIFDPHKGPFSEFNMNITFSDRNKK